MMINVHEAKVHLSRYLDRIERDGVVVVICRRNEPVAELRPLRRARSKRRPWGLDRGTFRVPDSFDERLSASELALWEAGPIFPTPRPRPRRRRR
jgi:prevent-host-death family protein